MRAVRVVAASLLIAGLSAVGATAAQAEAKSGVKASGWQWSASGWQW